MVWMLLLGMGMMVSTGGRDTFNHHCFLLLLLLLVLMMDLCRNGWLLASRYLVVMLLCPIAVANVADWQMRRSRKRRRRRGI
jgi:hypothetical protein